MESTDQVLDEQSQTTNHEAGEETTLVEVNGEKVDLEELKKGYMRQSDYTKKTQELSQQRKESTLSDEEKNAIEFLKSNKFVTIDDLEGMKKEQEQNLKLNEILATNPNLKQFETAIKAIGKTSDMAWEDIIVKFGFSAQDKLSKAKSGSLIGSGDKHENKVKSVRDMSPAEYEKFRAEQGIT